jgi:hypothetical protein
MLITLKHLLALLSLLFICSMAGATAAEHLRQRNEGLAVLTSVVFILVVPTLLAWPVFRLLSLRPLILPRCPHCGNRHGNYHVPREAWPAAVLLCVHCDKPLCLLLSAGARSIHPEVPAVTLRWPGFLGLWKRTSGVTPEGNRSHT